MRPIKLERDALLWPVDELCLKEASHKTLHLGKIQIATLPSNVRSSQGCNVGCAIFLDALWDNFIAWKQSARAHAYHIVASGSGCSPISFYEGVDPIQPHKA